MKKLIEIQSKLKAPKNQYNSFGKYHYRNCEDILEAVKPLLKENECTLNITDQVMQVGDLIFIQATATISDGENSISSTAQAGITPNRKGMDLSQSFGASSSYARKYALNGLFLIDDTKDADGSKITIEDQINNCKNNAELTYLWNQLNDEERKNNKEHFSKKKSELNTSK